MKKIKLSNGLQINKDAVSKLQETQMKDVKGGQAAFSCWKDSCNSKVAQEAQQQYLLFYTFKTKHTG